VIPATIRISESGFDELGANCTQIHRGRNEKSSSLDFLVVSCKKTQLSTSSSARSAPVSIPSRWRPVYHCLVAIAPPQRPVLRIFRSFSTLRPLLLSTIGFPFVVSRSAIALFGFCFRL
jgi:hypothetical protein